MFTVGNDVIDRAGEANGSVTRLCVGGTLCPVNMMITQVQVFAAVDMTGLVVGMFRESGGQYGASSAHSVTIGNVSAGLQTFSGLSLPAFAGDCLGFYFNNDDGRIENNTPGAGGDVVISGNYIGDTTLRTYVGGTSIASIGATGISGMVMPF